MFVLYNLLLLLASPVILAILLSKKRCRPGLRQRLGWLPRDLVQSRDGRQTIWVHAVSMGEATAVVPLVQQLKTRYPAARVCVSNVTETGKETVLRQLAGQAEHLYFPVSVTVDTHTRSEEHTSELQSRGYLVCLILLEKKERILGLAV